MRADGKPEGLRQSMSWLHTYTGLLLGWLLYAIFFTGTFSYFRSEVNDWMRPELHQGTYSEQSIARALELLQERAPEASSWSMSLPGPRRVAMDVSWRGANDPRTGRATNTRLTLNPETGEPVTPRSTRASNFFYRFHFELHGISRTNGRLIVGVATMLMLIAIISGVITHKKIFSDFFTFRPKKGQRSWLDAHNATAVLALPFHFIITFSGLLLIAGTLTPSWTFQGLGGGDQRGGGGGGGGGGRGGPPVVASTAGGSTVGGSAAGGNAAGGPQGRGGNIENRGGNPQAGRTGPQARGDTAGRGNLEGRGAQAAGRPGEQSGGVRQGGLANMGSPDAAPLAKAPLAPVVTMLHVANQAWPLHGAGSLTINDPGTVTSTVLVNERSANSIVSGGRGGGRTMRFNGVTGELIEASPAPASQASLVRKTRSVMVAIHEGRFAGVVTRWLLFLSGVLGTFMAASGMVLWVVKRMPERRKLGRTPISHRVVELLNVGAIAGLSIAMATLFWMNRLLPADLAERADWEIHGFFIAWLLCVLHPLLCTHRTAWVQQMALATAMYGLLPVLNVLTGGAALWQTMAAGQWSVANVDLILLAMAAMHGGVLWWLVRKPATKTAMAPKAAPGAAGVAGKVPPKAPPKAEPKAAPKPPPKAAPKPVPQVAPLPASLAATAASLAPTAVAVSSLVDAAGPILEQTS